MDTQEEKKSVLSPRTFCKWKMHRQTHRPESRRQTRSAGRKSGPTRSGAEGVEQTPQQAAGGRRPRFRRPAASDTRPYTSYRDPLSTNGDRWFLKGSPLPALPSGVKHGEVWTWVTAIWRGAGPRKSQLMI